MKRYLQYLMLFCYMLFLVHSMVPHCHAECNDDASDHCPKNQHLEESTLIDVLSSFLSNGAHPDLAENDICQIQPAFNKLDVSSVKKLPVFGSINDHGPSSIHLNIVSLFGYTNYINHNSVIFSTGRPDRGPPSMS